MFFITFGLPIQDEHQLSGSDVVNVALLKPDEPGAIPVDGTSTF